MIAAFTLAAILAPSVELTCPVMPHEAVDLKKPAMEYKGYGFIVCCAGCDKSFAKTPDKFVAKGAEASMPVGFTFFDVTTGKALSALKAKYTMASKGILYGFAAESGLKAFKANPAKFVAPGKESLKDAVTGKSVGRYSKAVGYVDYQGVRFYAGSQDSLSKMKSSPAKVLKSKLAGAAAPAVIE